MLSEYHVSYEVRKQGAIGVFAWQYCGTERARSESEARDIARERLNVGGYETRGVVARPVEAYRYAVIIPYTARGATEWHPSEPIGPFSTLVRGSFLTCEQAAAWAREKLGDTPYAFRRYPDFPSLAAQADYLSQRNR
jgi:hypothetical protein